VARDFTASASNYLSVGDVAAIDITGAFITIHCWFRPDINNAWQRLVTKYGAGQGQYALSVSDVGKVNVAVTDGSGLVFTNGNTTVSTGAWHAIGMTKDGNGTSNLIPWLDGSNNGNAVNSGSSIVNSTSPLRVGLDNDNFGPADGRIAEVAIWDVALTAAEFGALAKGTSPLFIRPAGLKGYWPIWGVASPEADLSGNGNNLSVTGTLALADHAPVGMQVPSAFAYDFESPTPAFTKTGVGIAGLAGAGTSASLFAELGFGVVGASGYGPKDFASVGSTYTKLGPGIVGTTGSAAGRLRVQPLGVSIGFGDTVLEPYPTWVRIDA